MKFGDVVLIQKVVIDAKTGVHVGYCSEGREWRDGERHDRPRPPLAPNVAVFVLRDGKMHDYTNEFRRYQMPIASDRWAS